MTHAASQPDRARQVDTLAKVGAVLAVAMPALGAGVRLIAFAAAGLPADLATKSDVPTLALAGFLALAPGFVAAVGLLGIVYLDVRFNWSSEDPAVARPRGEGRRLGDLRGWRLIVALLLLAAALVLFGGVIAALASIILNGGLATLLVVILGVVLPLGWLRRTVRGGTTRLSAIVVFALAYAAPFVALAGLQPPPAHAVHIDLHEPLAADSGWYDVFGSADGFVYGRSCVTGGPIAALPTRLIDRMELAAMPGVRPPAVSVGQVLAGTPMHLGFVSGCSGIDQP